MDSFSKLRIGDEAVIEVLPSGEWKVKSINLKKYTPHRLLESFINMNRDYEIFDYQKSVIIWMNKCCNERNNNISGGILALDMGLGKTLIMFLFMQQQLYHINSINEHFLNIIGGNCYGIVNSFVGKFTGTLVICPKTIMFSWRSEYKKFFGDDKKVLIYHRDMIGDNFNSINIKELSKYDIVITSYEVIMKTSEKYNIYKRQLIKDYNDRVQGIDNPIYNYKNNNKLITTTGPLLLFYINWLNIVADESHRFVNPKTHTFYSVMSLNSNYKWCLSGTPIRNYSIDLYSQLRFLGYDNVTIAKQFTQYNYEKEKLYNSLIHLTYEDAKIKLPEVYKHTVFLELDNKELDIYNYFLSATRNAYNGFLVGVVDFATVLVLFLRLRQVCISAYTIMDKNTHVDDNYTLSQQILDNLSGGLVKWINDVYSTSGIQSKKISKIIEILSTLKDKVVIFTMFKRVVNVLSIALKKHKITFLILDGDTKGIEREDVINKFKSEIKTQVIIITYKSGGEGLNLTEASNVILTEGWWCPFVLKQAERRVHRLGQKNKVNIWQLIIKNSIEEKIEEICSKKLDLAESFINYKSKRTNLNANTMGKILGVNPKYKLENNLSVYRGPNFIYKPSFFPDYIASDAVSFIMEKINEDNSKEEKEHFFTQPFVNTQKGKKTIPRLQKLMGNKNVTYTYSGSKMSSVEWNEPILLLKEYMEKFIIDNKIINEDTLEYETYNGVLINIYRDGKDHVSWHSDSGIDGKSSIAGVSFGATRRLSFRDNITKKITNYDIENNSLYLMLYPTNSEYNHCIRKSNNAELRINLTFRRFRIKH